MIPAPIPPGEARRLAALHALELLDAPPAAGLERITMILASALGVPIALVSLIDADRQWFAARVGLSMRQAPRELSLCSHVVAARQMLVVPDALRDERFFDNPLVVGPPRLRAYAGAPLMLDDGNVIGTLCAVDRLPRDFDAEHLSTLAYLRDLAVQQLRLTQVRARIGA